MVTSLTLDLSQFTAAQRTELLSLIVSFAKPRYIPTSDEAAEHDFLRIAEDGRVYL